MNHQLTDTIIARCKSLGFALAGVAPAEPPSRGRELREWLAAGKHGEMAYLERNLKALLDPGTLLPGVKSIICVADRYHDGSKEPPPALGAHDAPAKGRVARYARGQDYHKVIMRRLHVLCDALRREFPNEKFRACVDTAPLLEREYAQRAGLGSVGKHTLLIAPGQGSWLLLGEVLTTLSLTPSEPGRDDPCGTCTRCIDACPTEAITPWSVDARKCISYLTIEHRSAIASDVSSAMGDWIFGCDICQEVCPHNQPTRRALEQPTHTAYEPRRDSFDLLEVLGWSEEDRRGHFTRSAMKRAKLNMMKRNAIFAVGSALANPGVSEAAARTLRSRLEEIAAENTEDELVRASARAVLDR